MFRYKGSDVAVVLHNGVPFPVDPRRVYDADDLIVKERPDLFIRQAGSAKAAADEIRTLAARVAELETAVADLGAENAALTGERDAALADAEREPATA